MVDYPLAVLLFSFFGLWAAILFGSSVLEWWRRLEDDAKESYNMISGATLTLLGLIIAFSFSMAVGRYDQRKNYEEEEANAIGTEYVRAELLAAADAERVKSLLRSYLDQRIQWYGTRDLELVRQIDARTARIQNDMWAAVSKAATAEPTKVVMTVVVSGMNDVLNTQGYTQASWWNRIPRAAWLLMFSMAVLGCALVGYGNRDRKHQPVLTLVLPLVTSLSFFLIADIDSPRSGVIRVAPDNLIALAQSLRAP
jgi:hypothetical protein